MQAGFKLSIFIVLCRNQGSSRKTSTSASLSILKPSTVWITTNCGKFWNTRWPYLSPEKRMRVKKQRLEWDRNWFNIGKGIWQGYILSPCLFNICRVHHVKAGWVTIWNQDCQIFQDYWNINNLRYADDTALMAGSEEELRLPDGSLVKNLLAVQEMQETWVRFLGQEDPLEQCMAIHSSILP